MSESIKDGTGDGYLAQVDLTNRLKARVISERGAIEASGTGDAYFVTCGLITLTSANASAVLWYQNEDDFDLIMDRIVFSAGISTGGTTNMCRLAVTITPTGLGSGAGTEVIDINSNIGSAKSLDTSSSEIGQEAATVTGGTSGPVFFYPDKKTSEFTSSVLIPKKTGLAFSVTPPASNSSLEVSVAINVHKVVSI